MRYETLTGWGRLTVIGMLALVMAACGGNGGGTTMTETDPPETMPDPPPTCLDAPDNPNCTGQTQEDLDRERRAAMAEKLTPAIADPDGDGTLPEADELTAGRPVIDMINLHEGGMTTIGTDETDELGKNDTDIPNAQEFNKVMSATRATLTGFTAGVYERMKDKKTDTVTIYSNVEPAENQPFNTYYTDAGDHPGISGVGDDDQTEAEEGKTIYRTLTIESAVPKALAAKLMGSHIPTGPNGNFPLAQADDGMYKFTGTFDGIPGTYSCGTTACTITSDKDGAIAVTSGSLTFTPTPTTIDTDDVHMVKGVVKDMDYLSFGYWVQTQGTGDDMKYGVRTFASGNMPFGDPNDNGTAAITALRGTAKYDGSATGLYAKKTLSVVNGAVVGTPSEAGQFTADVSLTAHFGNVTTEGVEVDHISASEAYSISGTVSNFRNDGSDMIDSMWSLSLNRAKLGDGSTYTNTFTGDTGSGDKGQWTGGFFGPPPAGDDANTDYPTGAAGEFTGHFSNGHVIGAFGATKKD